MANIIRRLHTFYRLGGLTWFAQSLAIVIFTNIVVSTIVLVPVFALQLPQKYPEGLGQAFFLGFMILMVMVTPIKAVFSCKIDYRLCLRIQMVMYCTAILACGLFSPSLNIDLYPLFFITSSVIMPLLAISAFIFIGIGYWRPRPPRPWND